MSEALQKQKEKNGVMVWQDQEYAVGLLWLTSEDEEDPKAPRRRAKSLNADFYTVRDTIVQQNGFGFVEQKHRRRLPAAAATAADVMVGEWHGVFKADNGWWYVAVHADAIAPDGDLFFDNEEDAYQHFMQANETYRWPKVYAPESWEYKDVSGEITLDKIFDDIPDATLQPANMDALFGGKQNKDIAIVIGGILASIVFLAGFASQILPALLPQPRDARPVNVAVSNQLVAPPKPSVGQDVNPLLRFGNFSLPTPSFVIYSCLKGMEDIFIPLPNWNLDKVRCDGRLITVSWKSEGGDLDSIRPYISRFGQGVTHTYDGRRSFTATKLLPSLDQYKEQIIPLERDRAILLVNDRFGDLGRMSVEYIVPGAQKSNRRGRRVVQSLVDAAEEQKKPPVLQLDLETTTPATKTAEYFNIPGLSLNLIEYDLSKQTWNYEAKVILRSNLTKG